MQSEIWKINPFLRCVDILSSSIREYVQLIFHSVCSRFPLGRLRSSISSGKQVPLKSHCLSAETEKQPDIEALDYLPLVSGASTNTANT